MIERKREMEFTIQAPNGDCYIPLPCSASVVGVVAMPNGAPTTEGSVTLAYGANTLSVASFVNHTVDTAATWEDAESDFDTVLEAATAGEAGNLLTFSLIGDSSPAAGESVETDAADANHTIIHFESGVSTVADVEAALTAAAGDIAVGTTGTAITVLTTADNIVSASLSGGWDATPMAPVGGVADATHGRAEIPAGGSIKVTCASGAANVTYGVTVILNPFA